MGHVQQHKSLSDRPCNTRMPGIADETSTVPAPAAAAVQKLKTKEEALNACLEQHSEFRNVLPA